MEFRRGLKDGFPIFMGYFAVSVAFGILAVEKGCTIVQSVLISLCNLTSAGQFAGLTVIAGMGSLLELALSQLIINLRYVLMSISLSQKLAEDASGFWRWIIGFAVTDEIYAVAIGNEKIHRNYFLGLMITPIVGWTMGTFVGAVLGNILPALITDALGVALYGMFIAIVIPETKENRHVLATVCAAIALSAAFFYIPALKPVPDGFKIILCTLAASLLGAVCFPVREEVEDGV